VDYVPAGYPPDLSLDPAPGGIIVIQGTGAQVTFQPLSRPISIPVAIAIWAAVAMKSRCVGHGR